VVRRVLVWLVAALLLLGLVAMGAGGWYYSDQLLPAPPPFEPELTVEVIDSDEASGSLTLATTGGDLVALETVGAVSADGTVILEGPADAQPGGTARTGRLIEGTWPETGTLVGPVVDTYYGDPATTLGLPFEDVDVPSDLGVLPAWRVEPNGADAGTWVVVIHGRGGGLSEGNRLLPVLRELGLPSLSISVRNDPNAPVDPDGYGYYGDQEWDDLQAAIDHLVTTEGAQRIVLAGYSQGGSIALGFLRRSADAELVEAAVLISPLVSLNETLVLQAQARDIPDPVIPPLLLATRLITGLRSGLDFDEVNHLDQLDGLPDEVPMLVTHGSADETVPIGPTRELAEARPGQITYEEYPGAGHVREWNTDRERFEEDLRTFLTEHALTPAG
jgi:uncharacterized protein